MTARARRFRFSLAIAALCTALPALASPCAVPASYVKAPDAARAPLLRPFVLAGLTTTALQQRGGERWLELAAPNLSTAQRALAGVAGLAEAPRLMADSDGVVLLACSSLGGAPERVAQQGQAPLATPLW